MASLREAADKYISCLAVYREAGGCSEEERLCVLWVGLNRVKDPRFPNSLAEVFTQSGVVRGTGRRVFQFSCFNPNDVNAIKFPKLDDKVFLEIEALYDSPGVLDPTGGACFYHDHGITQEQYAAAVGVSIDKLVTSQTLRTNRFSFYKL